MGFDIEVGPFGTVVRILAYISRMTLEPSRLVYGVTINHQPAANHLWFYKDDAAQLLTYKPTPTSAPELLTTGMEVYIVGEVYTYWNVKNQREETNLNYIEVQVTGRKADRETMIKLCDNQDAFDSDAPGTVYLITPNGAAKGFGVGEPARKARDKQLDAMYFM